MQGLWVQCLVKELKSYMLRCMAPPPAPPPKSQNIGYFLLFSISSNNMIPLCKLRIYLEQLVRLLDQGLDYDENSQ